MIGQAWRWPAPLAEAGLAASYLTGLGLDQRHPLTLDQARAAPRGRLRDRAEDILVLARDAIHAVPSSSYRWLLHHVGCEYGDLERPLQV